MYNLLRRLLFLLIVVFSSIGLCAQQVTKEQLLKLFFKAQTALNKEETELAIDTYVEILKLSPGLPDTYLQLGNIYSTMTEDAVALEKACICYANYLKLKPEAVDAEILKTKISDMTLGIQQLKGNSAQISADLPKLAEQTQKLFEGGQLAELPSTPIKTDTPTVAVEEKKDTVAVVDTVKTVPVVPIDDSMLGRWASASLGHNGRENWILDISKTGDDYYFFINDSSFIKKTNERLKNIALEKVQVKFNENEMIVTYVAEEKEHKEDMEEKKSIGGLKDLLNVELNLDLFSSTNNEVVSNDTLLKSDSIIVVEPVIEYSYEFRLAYDGFKLNGTMAHRVVRKDTVETLLSEQKEECELFKAPDDYLGFVYKPIITASEKATKLEFRTLLYQKMQESTNSVMAINDQGCMYASGVGTTKNMKMAVNSFQTASMKGSMYGMLNLAKLYVDGVGVERDLEKARSLYTQAFEKGFTDAMVMCGDTYLLSASTEDDYKKALDCYLKAFYRRCPYAYYRLGWLYKEGLGIEVDMEKALEYYQKAVDMQFPDALAEMGIFYIKGDMVEKNIPKALDLLIKAANKDHANAMYALYEIFLRGEDGVKPDFKYAKDWYSKYMKANDKVIEGYNTIKSQVNSILSTK